MALGVCGTLQSGTFTESSAATIRTYRRRIPRPTPGAWRNPARGTEQPEPSQRDRRSHDDSCGLRDPPAQAQSARAGLWLGQAGRADSQDEAPRAGTGRLVLHVHQRHLQPPPHEELVMSDIANRYAPYIQAWGAPPPRAQDRSAPRLFPRANAPSALLCAHPPRSSAAC